MRGLQVRVLPWEQNRTERHESVVLSLFYLINSWFEISNLYLEELRTKLVEKYNFYWFYLGYLVGSKILAKNTHF